MSTPVMMGPGNFQFRYSLSEQVTDETWIDTRPIYCKVVVIPPMNITKGASGTHFSVSTPGFYQLINGFCVGRDDGTPIKGDVSVMTDSAIYIENPYIVDHWAILENTCWAVVYYTKT